MFKLEITFKGKYGSIYWKFNLLLALKIQYS